MWKQLKRITVGCCLNHRNCRQVLECGDGACAVTAFACAGLTLPKLAADGATLSQSGDSADSVAALQDAVAPRPVSSKFSVNHYPERGSVVLDQPQHAVKLWCFGFFHALRLVFDTAALLSAALTTVSFLLLCPASAHAQGGVPLWTNRYDGPANIYDRACAIAVDSRGNVFVTGCSDGCTDYLTIGYSNSGVTLWTNRYTGPGNHEDVANAIAVDGSGNVFVTGSSHGSNDNPEFATIKYSNAGVSLWTNRYSEGFSVAYAIAVDSNGNVFVTGTGPSASGGNDADYATLAYSNSGVPLWTNRYNGPRNGDDFAGAIAVDRSGNVFVTGNSYNGSNFDYATVKYSNAGVPLWTNRYNGGDHDFANAIALDRNGNVFVTGYSTGSGGGDYATVAYSNAGAPRWTNRYDGPANYGDQAKAIAVDSNGNVFVTGSSDDVNGHSDYATIKYSNSGVPLWTNRYDGPTNLHDVAYAIAVDSNGNVFVTGTSMNTPCCPANVDYATIAYSNAGEPLWENRYNGPDNLVSWPHAIAVDSAGNVIVTGESLNGPNYDYVTIKYSSSIPPPVLLDFQLLNNQLVLSWTNAPFNLQTAPAVTGPFTNVPAATSPYTNVLTGPQQFFRLTGE